MDQINGSKDKNVVDEIIGVDYEEYVEDDNTSIQGGDQYFC